jgi:hypothetical protein
MRRSPSPKELEEIKEAEELLGLRPKPPEGPFLAPRLPRIGPRNTAAIGGRRSATHAPDNFAEVAVLESSQETLLRSGSH